MKHKKFEGFLEYVAEHLEQRAEQVLRLNDPHYSDWFHSLIRDFIDRLQKLDTRLEQRDRSQETHTDH